MKVLIILYRAGGRNDILLKRRPCFCHIEEARRRMPGDPANVLCKNRSGAKKI